MGVNRLSFIDIEIDNNNSNVIDIDLVEKFNPYHDKKTGRFTTAENATVFTIRTKDPKKQYLADRGIEREKKRTAEAGGTGAKYSQSMEQAYGLEKIAEMNKLLKDSPEFIQTFWNNHSGCVQVGETDRGRTANYNPTKETINLNIERDAKGSEHKTPYETTFHESAHAMDYAIGKQSGMYYKQISTEYRNGLFEETLKKEADTYIKNHQKKLAAERGQKVSIQAARDDLGSIMRREGTISTGDVSDMLEGATKGKFMGSAGHGKAYWTGHNTYWGKTPGHSVATEAFAEMFSASITNKASLAKIKEVFPESYSLFQEMIEGVQV